MTFAGMQKLAAYLAVFAGFVSILLSGEIPTQLALAAAAAFVASWFVGERVAGRGTAIWNTGIVGALLFLGGQVITGRLDVVVATSMFAVLLSLNRLFNRRTVRDYGTVHLTALLMIAGGAALSAELAFGLCFALFAVAATWSLTLTQLRVEIEDEAAANKVADGGASLLQSRRVVSPRFLALLGGLAFASLGVAAAVFVLFPRVSFGLWQRRGAQGTPTVGFSQQVQLGGFGRIKDDPRVAFRVRASEGRPLQGDTLDVHWRGAAFDTFDGRGWKDAGGPPRPVRSQMLWYAIGERQRPFRELKIELAADASATTVFTPENAFAVRMLPRQFALRVVEGPRLLRDEQGDLSFAPAQQSEVNYLVQSPVAQRGELRGRGTDYPEAVRARYLAIPPLDPRVLELARTLVADRDPADAATEVESYLLRYTYSLENLPSGADPVASFLFDVKSGHCEYFATSMALLLRAGGVPARLVTGFYGGRWVEQGEYYAVRQGDAHAWVEVWFPERGWVTFDPTPPNDRPGALATIYGELQLWIDAVETQWRASVVEYDILSQVNGLKSMAAIARDFGDRFQAAGGREGLVVAGRALAVTVFVLALGFGVVLLLRRRRGRPVSRSESERRARSVYLQLERRLLSKGLAPRPSRTARELAAEAIARGLAPEVDVRRIVERYLLTRYGGVPLDASEYGSLKREINRI